MRDRRDHRAAAALLRAFADQDPWRHGVVTIPGPFTEPQRALALELMVDATIGRRAPARRGAR